MRQLATLPKADDARTFADHLQTLRIETRLEQLPEGWAVWVCDEDRLPQAREVLAAFTRNPADQRFVAARQAGEATRRRREREAGEEAAPAPRRPEPRAPGRPGPWTYSLIVTCLLVFAVHTGYLLYANAALGANAVGRILLGQATGLDVPTSPVQQALSIASFHVEPEGDQVKFTWFWLQDVEHGQVWRLVTPIFLHFGLIHLLFNLTMLWQLGLAVEVRRGAWRYLALVLATAVLSNVAQYYLSDVAWGDGGLTIHSNPAFGGMSGVLYGLFGYVWMKSRFAPEAGLSLSPRIVWWMLAWLILCMTGMIGSIANTAHVVGLLVGVVIGAAPYLWRLALGRPTR